MLSSPIKIHAFIPYKKVFLQDEKFWKEEGTLFLFKGTVMQIKKALINNCLRVSKVSLKLRILTIYNFAVIYP